VKRRMLQVGIAAAIGGLVIGGVVAYLLARRGGHGSAANAKSE
jgi:uncharacterized membrane protein YdjX (TVP38/TMEM64 family)